MRNKQKPMILAGLAFFLFSLFLLALSQDEINKSDLDLPRPSSTVKAKLKLTTKNLKKSKVTDNKTPTVERAKTIEKSDGALSERYFGRVVDEHGFGLAGCRVYLSDDWNRFDPTKPDLYDDLRRVEKAEKSIQTSDYRLEATKKPAPQTYEAVTDIEGRFAIDLKETLKEVPLLKIEGPKGFQHLCRQVALPKNKDFGDTVLLQTGKVYGSVSNIANEVVENAAVVLVTAEYFEKYLQSSNINIFWYPHRVTKSDGAFEFDDVPAGRYYLTCKAAKTRESSVPVTVQAGSMISQDLVLRPGLRIELTLQDREGHAIPNAKVSLRSSDPWCVFNEVESRMREIRTDVHRTTDEHGHASLDPVYEDHLRLTIAAPGFGESHRWIKSVQGVDRMELRIVLAPTTIIQGRVLDADGLAPKAKVFLESVDRSGERSYDILLHQNADDQGQFELSSVSPGKYFLRIARIEPNFYEKPLQEYQRSIIIPPHKPVIQLGTVRLKRACTVRCAVLDADDAPVPKVSVTALQQQEKLFSNLPTDENGVVSLSGLIPGPAMILVRNDNGAIAVQNIVVPDSAQSDQRIHLPNQMGRLRITLVDHLDRPVTSGCFVLRVPGPTAQCLQISDDLLQESGQCTLTNLPPGLAKISFYSEYPRRIRRLELGQAQIRGGEMTELSLQLPAPK